MFSRKKFLSAVAALAISSAAFSGISAFAEDTAVQNQTLGYINVSSSALGTYTVQEGDTLSSIAKKSGISAEDIKGLNKLTSDLIIPGQVLRLSETAEIVNLTIDSKGERVTQVQNYLSKLGFYNGDVNGNYDLETARGTVRFQRSKGIYADGKIDTNTYSELIGEYNNNISENGTSISDSASTDEVNLTIDSKGELVAKVQNYLIKLGYYSGEADGTYDLETARGVVRFQRSKGIYAHGKVDENTYNALVKEIDNRARRASSRGGLLDSGAVAYDWWQNVNNDIFPRGTVAKVTDVYTRKVFYIKRTYGSNHADCEALTLEDTNIIKSIWGGFSWDRRPVVVEANGYRIAASMAGMPHAGLDRYPEGQTVSGRSGGYGTGYNFDDVKGNGMDGHFDIHFLNSRTHGTDKVDSEHQAAIRQAIGR